MIPNITRGGKMAGLMVYLAGPGRANEHENPRLVAGHDIVTFTVDPGRVLTRDDALDIANALDQPRRVHGTAVTSPTKQWDAEAGKKITVGRRDSHVWHCSLSLGSDDGSVSDDQWRMIAEDFVQQMGFVDPDGAKTSRWAALHHGASKNGNDHIHIVVQMVREDGTKAVVNNDFQRAQAVAHALEKTYGLTVLESREVGRGSLAGHKPAEQARALAEQRPATHKDLLRQRVRSAVALSSDEREFISRLRENRVLVRPRFSAGSTSKVEGYSVALEPRTIAGKTQSPVWYAPSKMDRSLGLGRLRARWNDPEAERSALPAWQVQAGRAGETHTGAGKIKPRKLPASISRRLSEAERAGAMDAQVAADLSAILSHLSVTMEKGTPGPFARAADDVARGHQYNVPARKAPSAAPAGYHARLMDRALSRDSQVGWKAVAQQALRMTRLMGRTTLADRPRLMSQVSTHLDSALAARPELVRAGAPATSRGRSTAARPFTPTQSPTDHDRGRD